MVYIVHKIRTALLYVHNGQPFKCILIKRHDKLELMFVKDFFYFFLLKAESIFLSIVLHKIPCGKSYSQVRDSYLLSIVWAILEKEKILTTKNTFQEKEMSAFINGFQTVDYEVFIAPG